MKLESTNVTTTMDPKLQKLVERRRRGLTTLATSSTSEGEIAVIAKVKDRQKWNDISEVREGVEIGNDSDNDGCIVTARIPVERIEALRKHEVIISLKPAKRLSTKLSATIEEINARADLLPRTSIGNQGKGVIVGIIDYGCDFAHKNFINPNGTSRILALWDQSGSTTSASPFGYGTEYTQAQINQALRTSNPYSALGYSIPRGTHGTHVMDISAGNGFGTGTPGVAPNSDIIFVHISNSDIPFDGEEVVNSTFGDSVHLLEALKYIFDKAGQRPCVINISLGTNGGPHDGSTLVEKGIDSLVSQFPNRAVVIAASNSHEDGIHAAGKVNNGQSVDIIWEIFDDDQTSNELEVWYEGNDEFKLEIITPDGDSVGEVALGQNARLRDDKGNTALFIAHRRNDPNNHNNVIGMFMEAGLPAGGWKMRLHGEHVQDGKFHAWIERDDNGQSRFSTPHDNTHTLGSISCGYKSIVVGSYDAHKISKPISFFSSEGPTRDNRQKPEISSPGHNVLAASSTTGVGVLRMSGTSMAAPAVTGVVALILAEAHVLGINLSIDQIRKIVQDSGRHNPPNLIPGQWDSRYGNGRIDASAAILAVRQLIP